MALWVVGLIRVSISGVGGWPRKRRVLRSEGGGRPSPPRPPPTPALGRGLSPPDLETGLLRGTHVGASRAVSRAAVVDPLPDERVHLGESPAALCWLFGRRGDDDEGRPPPPWGSKSGGSGRRAATGLMGFIINIVNRQRPALLGRPGSLPSRPFRWGHSALPWRFWGRAAAAAAAGGREKRCLFWSAGVAPKGDDCRARAAESLIVVIAP